jgi:hypothetical protein
MSDGFCDVNPWPSGSRVDAGSSTFMVARVQAAVQKFTAGGISCPATLHDSGCYRTGVPGGLEL